jgi:hypothetical protein
MQEKVNCLKLSSGTWFVNDKVVPEGTLWAVSLTDVHHGWFDILNHEEILAKWEEPLPLYPEGTDSHIVFYAKVFCVTGEFAGANAEYRTRTLAGLRSIVILTQGLKDGAKKIIELGTHRSSVRGVVLRIPSFNIVGSQQ